MSFNFINQIKAAVLLSAIIGAAASASHARKTYVLTITNGGAMPISPGVIYALPNQKGLTPISSEPSSGLIQLCQTGNGATLVSELKANSEVKAVVQTSGPILPGQSVSAEIQFENYGFETLHFVAMYGKSKELCSSITIQAQELNVLRKGFYQILGSDKVISSGAFTEPVASPNAENICADSTSAVECLRNLSVERTDKKQIHYFGGYLPSLLNFLENKFGSEDVLSLIIPTNGAVTYSLGYKQQH